MPARQLIRTFVNLATNWQQHCQCDRNATAMRTGAASPSAWHSHHDRQI